MSKTVRKVFASSTNWVCPAGVTFVRLFGRGGGGGGSGGVKNPAAGQLASGGLGGGGSSSRCLTAFVSPGTVYVVTVGSGGSGSAGSSTGSSLNGNPGGVTSFVGGSVNIQFYGASGGGVAVGGYASPSGSNVHRPGGAPNWSAATRFSLPIQNWETPTLASDFNYYSFMGGVGGSFYLNSGGVNINTTPASASYSAVGGTVGATSADSNRVAPGTGGGGGDGPGGNGGIAVTAGVGGVGSNGVDGGGGGGGGSASSTGTSGGSGGNGGSGQLIIEWEE